MIFEYSIRYPVAIGCSAALHIGLIGILSLSEHSVVEVQRAHSAIELTLAEQQASSEQPDPKKFVTDDVSLKSSQRRFSRKTPPAEEVIANPLPGAVTNAQPIRHANKPPVYPRLARLAGMEGTVLLHVEVEEDGSVKETRVVESSGYRSLDQSSMKAVRRWRFQPAQHFGHVVKDTLEIPIVFRLAGFGGTGDTVSSKRSHEDIGI